LDDIFSNILQPHDGEDDGDGVGNGDGDS